MTRKRKDLFFWILVAAIIGGQCLALYLLFQNNAGPLDVLGWITSAIIPSSIFIFDRVQRRSISFYLFVQRVRAIFNPIAPSWTLSANFTGEAIKNDTLDAISRKIFEVHRSDKNISQRINSPFNRQVFITPGPTLEMEFNSTQPSPIAGDGKLSPYIQIVIRNYRVGYREATKAIQQEIIPILEDIASIVPNVETKYTLIIEFDKNRNPFFGMYIAHFDPAIISSFGIQLVINDFGRRNTVSISDSRITINTQTQNALQHLALEFLTFDPSLQERFAGG